MIKEYKTIIRPDIARKMLKMGHIIHDIKANKEDKHKTVFVFKTDETFFNDLKSLLPAKAKIADEAED